MEHRLWVDNLFRQHAEALLRYLRTFRLGEEETWDMVQSCFLKLLKQKPGQVKQPKAWLYACGRNLAINTYKKQGRLSFLGGEERIEDEAPDGLTRLLSEEKNRRMWQVFQSLPVEEQELLRLRLEHKMSYEDLGKIIGKKPGTVRVLIHRSREKLKVMLDKKRKEDESNKEISTVKGVNQC